MSEPCPECKGKCCRDADYGYRVEHMGAECYEHVCEACLDGDRYVPPRSPEDERADVLAYLTHALSYGFTTQSAYDPRAASPALYPSMLRDLIAEGEHVGWAKKERPQ